MLATAAAAAAAAATVKSADLDPDNGICSSLMDEEMDDVGVDGVTGDILAEQLEPPAADSLLELFTNVTSLHSE